KFVMEADNGEDLIQKIPESQPDVILCDLKMPIKDGIDATKRISINFADSKELIDAFRATNRLTDDVSD
ncbi:MAG: response regulator transcription factor, partial [Flavobacterium sp.]